MTIEQQMINELVKQLNHNDPNANDVFWDMHDLFDTESDLINRKEVLNAINQGKIKLLKKVNWQGEIHMEWEIDLRPKKDFYNMYYGLLFYVAVEPVSGNIKQFFLFFDEGEEE